MKDFDQEREARSGGDRRLRIGGEEFVRRDGVRPEVLARYEDLQPGTASAEVLKVIDEIVLAFLEPHDGAHDRYLALRQREDGALTTADLNALVQWLVSEEAGRPTQASSPSTAGRDTTGTPSTDSSSSPVALVSTG